MTSTAAESSFATASPSLSQPPDGPAYTSLWRGILLVEPDITLLTAETLLLTRSDYCVTPAFSQAEIFALRDTKAVALAILSASLGHRLLTAVAQTVRVQWPRARILICGRAGSPLEDHLYDELINHPSDPTKLLEAIEGLYKGSWNRRSHTLDWDGKRAGSWAIQSLVRESDPTKSAPLEVAVDKNLRGTPSGIRYRPR